MKDADNTKAHRTCCMCTSDKQLSVPQYVRHLENVHGVKPKSFKGTPLYTAWLASRRKTKAPMSDLERQHVSVAANEEEFTCIECDKTLRKISAMSHFMSGKHNIDKHTLTKWFVVEDGRALKRGRTVDLRLSSAAAEGVDDTHDDFDDDRAMPPSPDNVPLHAPVSPGEASQSGSAFAIVERQPEDAVSSSSVCLPSAMSVFPAVPQTTTTTHFEEDVRSVLRNMEKTLARAVAPKDVEVTVPAVAVNACPITICQAYRAEGLDKHLFAQGLQAQAVDENCEANNRFFNMLVFDGAIGTEPHWHIGVLARVYQDDLLEELFSLDCLDPTFSWSRRMASTLHHFIRFAVVQCTRRRLLETKIFLESLAQDAVNPYKKRTSKGKVSADKKKFRTDAIRIGKFPLMVDMKTSVRLAMVDLHRLLAQGEHTENDEAAANIAMVGIIYLNGFAGRSGEWQKMKRAYVQDQLNMNCASLTCKEHKTSNEYSELCKWISRGTAEAMKTYLMLPGKTSDLFLEPVRASTSHTAVHSCLKRFGEIYWPTHQAPACNLVRKLFHARLKKMSHKNKVWNLISKVDAHSEEVASKIYAVSTAEDDVELGKNVVPSRVR